MMTRGQILRHVRAALFHRCRTLRDVLDEDRRRAVGDERRLAREHLIAQDSQRVQIAASGSIVRSPAACSGLMYVGVPIAMPVAVSRESRRSSRAAIPKSVTIGRPLCWSMRCCPA